MFETIDLIIIRNTVRPTKKFTMSFITGSYEVGSISGVWIWHHTGFLQMFEDLNLVNRC